MKQAGSVIIFDHAGFPVSIEKDGVRHRTVMECVGEWRYRIRAMTHREEERWIKSPDAFQNIFTDFLGFDERAERERKSKESFHRGLADLAGLFALLAGLWLFVYCLAAWSV